jgi:1,4-alpha-glucan branching enzyme
MPASACRYGPASPHIARATATGAAASGYPSARTRRGVRVTCVDWTDRGPEHQRPVRSPAGPVLVPIDREVVELVWSPDGYPCDDAYLDTHWVTERKHRVRAIDGSPYDPDRAAAKLLTHADDFVARVRAREGLTVCALDTELLGHWWPEGVDWLAAVLDRAAEQGLEVLPLEPDLVDGAPPMTAVPPVTSWGTPRDLTTWSAPSAGGLAWRQRAAELRVLANGANDRALRELLAFQSSDWAFLITRATAGPYPQERAEGHAAALERALTGEETAAELRNLAPYLQASAFREP